MTFFEVVTNSGVIGLIIWIVVFTMWPVGIALGIISIIAASYRKKQQLPLSFKILIIIFVMYLFIGCMGAIWTSIISSGAIEITTGSEKATMLALSISNSLYILSFSLLGTIPFLLSIAVSIHILHFKEFPMSSEELNPAGEEQS